MLEYMGDRTERIIRSAQGEHTMSKYKHVDLGYMLIDLVSCILQHKSFQRYFWRDTDGEMHEINQCNLFQRNIEMIDGDFTEIDRELEDSQLYLLEEEEMRLIDAENLKEQVKVIHKAVDTTSVNCDYDTGFHSATSQIMGLIDYMPTAKAIPVTRGKWKLFRKGIDYQCSECYWSTDFDIPRNFCPNCGADMREGGTT